MASWDKVNSRDNSSASMNRETPIQIYEFGHGESISDPKREFLTNKKEHSCFNNAFSPAHKLKEDKHHSKEHNESINYQVKKTKRRHSVSIPESKENNIYKTSSNFGM